ncbi:RNA polymerase sigma factor [Planctomycetota bacterium]
MQGRDYTDIGGTGRAFLTTHWSLIEEVQQGPEQDLALVGVLLERYWKPVYCYCRQKGYDNEQAKDLTQGFFHDIVLNLNLIQRADPSKGRFRSFLLHALNQYLMNDRRRENAIKRIPPNKIVSLDSLEIPVLPQSVTESGPEHSYHYAWVSTLLDQVLSEVQRNCVAQGLDIHWQVFQARVVQPLLHNTTARPLSELCDEYGIESEKKASNMIVTVKRRFQTTLKEAIRNTVTSEAEIADELQEIMQFLPKRAQHSQ